LDKKKGGEARMRVPTDLSERNILLQKLREAVVYQIGLWDTAQEIEEIVNCEMDYVLQWVVAASIVADDGMSLTNADLDEFLGVESGPNRRSSYH
jgi:hypothetical protein